MRICIVLTFAASCEAPSDAPEPVEIAAWRGDVDGQCWERGTYEFPAAWAAFLEDCTADLETVAVAPDGTCYYFGSYCEDISVMEGILEQSGYTQGDCPGLAWPNGDLTECPSEG
jgi:hypothetical protein